MYQLSNEEKGRLKLWAKDKRYEFFKKNKYIFVEENTIDDMVLYSNINVEEEIIENEFMDCKKDLKNLFNDDELCSAFNGLSQNDQSIIRKSVFEEKKDKEIANDIGSSEDAIRTKRNRIYTKIRKNRKGDKRKNV